MQWLLHVEWCKRIPAFHELQRKDEGKKQSRKTYKCLFIISGKLRNHAYISVFFSFFPFCVAYKRYTVLFPLLSVGFLFGCEVTWQALETLQGIVTTDFHLNKPIFAPTEHVHQEKACNTKMSVLLKDHRQILLWLTRKDAFIYNKIFKIYSNDISAI